MPAGPRIGLVYSDEDKKRRIIRYTIHPFYNALSLCIKGDTHFQIKSFPIDALMQTLKTCLCFWQGLGGWQRFQKVRWGSRVWDLMAAATLHLHSFNGRSEGRRIRSDANGQFCLRVIHSDCDCSQRQRYSLPRPLNSIILMVFVIITSKN